MLTITSPLLIIIAILIKATSKGPAIFVQTRVGQESCLFSLYKFRTMIYQSKKIRSSVTTAVDSTITSFGKILRRTKIDELPQLWNVIKGDMSLVGPRPDVPEIIEQYSTDMLKILKLKPGITSVATMHLRNEERLLTLAKEPERAYIKVFVPIKVRLSMEHLYRNSLMFDMKILFQTIWLIIVNIFCPIKDNYITELIKKEILIMNC